MELGISWEHYIKEFSRVMNLILLKGWDEKAIARPLTKWELEVVYLEAGVVRFKTACRP